MSIKPHDIYSIAIMCVAFFCLLFIAMLSLLSDDKETADKGTWKDKKPPHVIKIYPLPDDISKDIDCMTRNIFHESRSETEVEWKAITDVAFNRMMSDKYPDEICRVIMQDSQFSWTLMKESELIRREQKEPKRYYAIREQISEWVMQWHTGHYNAADKTKNAMHYHKKDVKPFWRNIYTRVAVIGEHIYYEH